MKDTAQILAFKGKRLTTIEELRAALFAIIQDMQSGAVTRAESRAIQKEINARMKFFSNQVKRMNKGEVLTPIEIKSINQFFCK